jgi:DNA-binding PadR family transcriptional regulator
MPRADRDPRSFLPLTPLVFHVLLALADGPRHGYAIISEVDERTGGIVRLRTGTLYVLLAKLHDRELISETDEPAAPKASAGTSDARRRYYAITALGLAVVQAEARRLEAVLEDARRTRVLGRSSRA